MSKRRMATKTTLVLAGLVLIGCTSTLPPGSVSPFAYLTLTPSPPLSPADIVYNQDAAYAAAQATLTSGQNEAMGLAHQATLVSLNVDQAANIAAQATMDYNQRQLMELSIQGTEIGLNMARAAATQQFINGQTQSAWDATATTQSQSATAAYSAYSLSATETAQAQEVLNAQAASAALARTTREAYALTATPQAVIQADILQRQTETRRDAWWQEFVLNPLTVILITLLAALLMVGGVLAYLRLMPVLELRLRTISREDDRTLLLVNGMLVDHVSHAHHLTTGALPLFQHSRVLDADAPLIEIIDPSDDVIADWISEAEGELRPARWMQS